MGEPGGSPTGASLLARSPGKARRRASRCRGRATLTGAHDEPRHEHRVDAGALQLGRARPGWRAEVGDGELARRALGSRSSRSASGRLAAPEERASARGRGARAPPRARPRPRPDDELHVVCESTSSAGPTTRASAPASPEVRIGRALAARIASTSRRRAPPRRRLLGPLAAARPVHRDDQRDAVALGDGLAQTSGAGHARRWYLSWVWLTCAGARGARHRGLRGCLPAVAEARYGRRWSAPQRADLSSGARAPTGWWRGVATTGSPPSTTALRPVSCGTGRDSSPPTRATGSGDCEVVSRRLSRPARERRGAARVGGRARLAHGRRDHGGRLPGRTHAHRAAPRASASPPRRTADEPGARASCPV